MRFVPLAELTLAFGSLPNVCSPRSSTTRFRNLVRPTFRTERSLGGNPPHDVSLSRPQVFLPSGTIGQYDVCSLQHDREVWATMTEKGVAVPRFQNHLPDPDSAIAQEEVLCGGKVLHRQLAGFPGGKEGTPSPGGKMPGHFTRQDVFR
jgi:hypothetical protein